MKRFVLLFLFLPLLLSIRTQEPKSPLTNIVLLGAYQMETTDWSALEEEYSVEKVTVRDFTSHQLTWIIDNLVLVHQPKYCVLHTGLEDLFLDIPEQITLQRIEDIITMLENNHIQCIVSNIFNCPSDSIFNGRVESLNKEIREMAVRHSVKHIDGYAMAEILPVFTTEDCELNKLGMDAWNSLILSALNDERQDKEIGSSDFHYENLSANRIERIMKESPDEVKICMLGNSITEAGNWNELLQSNSIRNCGQGGYTTGQMLWHMDATVISARPSHCFIMGGINDFSMDLEYQTVWNNFVEIIKRLEDAKIQPVVQSTLFQAEGSPNNSVVKQLNTDLKQLCEKMNLDFLDINSVLSRNEALELKYSTDGTHLNQEGYEKWGKFLRVYFRKKNLE